MTDEQRARELVSAEPCNYGGPYDDKAEMDWRASMDKILAAFADVRADEQKNVRHMLEYADAMSGYLFNHYEGGSVCCTSCGISAADGEEIAHHEDCAAERYRKLRVQSRKAVGK